MKAPGARLALLLSIGGVLAAGSAAALVNSRVLDDQSGGAPASATAVTTSVAAAVTTTTILATTAPTTLETTAPTTATSTIVTPTTAAPTTAATAPAVSATAPAATVPAVSTQATYRVGDAGTALLDTAGGRLTIVSVTPSSGWFVERARSDGASVEIRMESDSGEVRFEATLVRGVVRVSLETDDDSSGPGGGNGGDGGGDDDNSGPGSDDD